MYTVVLEAQARAIAALRPGVDVKVVDAAARGHIADAGFGDHFTHGLGHGIGLEVHEAPAIRSNSDDVLRAGMVVTIEPGVYLPDWGGVRIEDDVLVTPDGRGGADQCPEGLGKPVIAERGTRNADVRRIPHSAFRVRGGFRGRRQTADEDPGPVRRADRRELVELMAKHDLSEVDLNEGDQRIRLREEPVRGRRPRSPPRPRAIAHAAAAGRLPAAPPRRRPPRPRSSSRSRASWSARSTPSRPRTSPTTSRSAPRSRPDTVVCQIEAMKIFNDITAECTGTIAEVCVKNGESVEFDTGPVPGRSLLSSAVSGR